MHFVQEETGIIPVNRNKQSKGENMSKRKSCIEQTLQEQAAARYQEVVPAAGTLLREILRKNQKERKSVVSESQTSASSIILTVDFSKIIC
jgi:hypothetical protein